MALLALVLGGCSLGGSGTTTSTAPKIGVGTQSTVAVAPSATDLQQTVENVIKAVQPSVVEVVSTTPGGQSEGIGSGDILTSDGYIVTNDHVVSGFSTYSVQFANAKTMAATLVGQAPGDDLAVIKVNATGLTPIAVGDSAKVQVGQFAIAVGSPLGLAQSATFGIVSAVNRPASEAPNGPAGTLTGLIQTSAPINPGNSGGALVDLTGQLIGIPTLGAVDPNSGSTAPGIGFAIPSDRVKFVAQQLIQYGHVVNSGEGFLGIQGEDVNPVLAADNGLPVTSGVLIAGFAPDASGSSPAQKAGMRVGDIIVALNGTNIPDSATLSTVLNNEKPGTKVSVTVARGSSRTTLTITLGQKPE